MNQARLNEAVNECVRHALGEPEPLRAIEEYIQSLRDDQWPMGQMEVVKATAMRMVSSIYDAGGAEADEQAD